jgi:hypothetical protein
MKFFISLLLTALLSFVLCLFMGWWSIALAAFVVAALIHQPPRKAFLTGFSALFGLWGIMAWWIDAANNSVLSHRMASLLPFGGSAFIMILVTALVGALVAGFAALTGSYLGTIGHVEE